jgi:beta-lactam-binding protein with PASTA domain
VIGFFRFVLITMMLVLIATISAVVTMRFAIHGAEVTIPDFKGLPLAVATQKAAQLGVALSVEGGLYSTELGAGRVLTQTPAPGTMVRREWQVRVTDSLGPQRVAIPNVLGEQERLASIAIRRVGLELGAVAHIPDAQVPPGTVISQNPLPMAAGVERPNVSILVADAEPETPSAFIMPNYIGKPAADAGAELVHAGLPAPIERDALPSSDGSVGGAAGTIVRQSPAPGEKVSTRTAIVFDVAR